MRYDFSDAQLEALAEHLYYEFKQKKGKSAGEVAELILAGNLTIDYGATLLMTAPGRVGAELAPYAWALPHHWELATRSENSARGWDRYLALRAGGYVDRWNKELLLLLPPALKLAYERARFLARALAPRAAPAPRSAAARDADEARDAFDAISGVVYHSIAELSGAAGNVSAACLVEHGALARMPAEREIKKKVTPGVLIRGSRGRGRGGAGAGGAGGEDSSDAADAADAAADDDAEGAPDVAAAALAAAAAAADSLGADDAALGAGALAVTPEVAAAVVDEVVEAGGRLSAAFKCQEGAEALRTHARFCLDLGDADAATLSGAERAAVCTAADKAVAGALAAREARTRAARATPLELLEALFERQAAPPEAGALCALCAATFEARLAALQHAHTRALAKQASVWQRRLDAEAPALARALEAEAAHALVRALANEQERAEAARLPEPPDAPWWAEWWAEWGPLRGEAEARARVALRARHVAEAERDAARAGRAVAWEEHDAAARARAAAEERAEAAEARAAAAEARASAAEAELASLKAAAEAAAPGKRPRY